MVSIIQHRINANDRRDANRTRRKPCILIRVIRTIHLQMIIIDSTKTKLFQGKLHGRIGLKQHSFRIDFVVVSQTIIIHSRNHGFLPVVCRFLVYDAGKDNHLVRSKAHRLGLCQSLLIPKLVAFFLHPIEESIHAYVPIHVIRIGNNHTSDGCRIISIFLANLGISQGLI